MTRRRKTTRPDAWWAALSESQCWALYAETRPMTWCASVERARAMTGGSAPSRSAWYRFEQHFRACEAAHRLELAARARAEAKGLADKAGAAGETAKAFLALATEIALRTGSAEDAEAWTRQAASLYAAAARDRGLALRAEASRLAREKFEAAEQRLKDIRETVAAAKGTDGGLSAEALAKIEQAASLL